MSSVNKDIGILVVDDYLTMRRIVRSTLSQLGFSNIQEAKDGVEALEKINANKFDLIISDWNMPNMMGIDLLKAVRSNEKLKSVPFIMVTAEAEKENIIEAAKAGVSNYVLKPFTADSLSEKIEAVLCKK